LEAISCCDKFSLWF